MLSCLKSPLFPYDAGYILISIPFVLLGVLNDRHHQKTQNNRTNTEDIHCHQYGYLKM